MENFNDLQDVWRSNEDTSPLNLSEIRTKAEGKIRSQQKRLILTNIGLTLSFILVIGVMVWIYTSFPGRSLYFKISIAFMGLLLIVYLAGMWSSLLYRNIDPDNTPAKYIHYASNKIKIRIYMLEKGTIAYSILLYIALIFYLWDVLKGAEVWLFVLVYAAVTLYILMIWFFFRKKRNNQIAQYKDTLEELRKWGQVIE